MIALALALAMCCQGDPAAELDHWQAAIAENPNDARAHHQLGDLLARAYATPDAIPVLQRAIQLGLEPEAERAAQMWIPYLLVEAGRDREAVAEARTLLARLPAGSPVRPNIEALLGSIAARHAALDGVAASETRAIIACVLALLAIAGGFWVGRRVAIRTQGAA